MVIKAGSWVQIHRIILSPEERAQHLPEDTKKVPLEMWVKGTLLHDAKPGDEVEIQTVTKRIEKGTLVCVNPYYSHSFGFDVPELRVIQKQVKTMLRGDHDE